MPHVFIRDRQQQAITYSSLALRNNEKLAKDEKDEYGYLTEPFNGVSMLDFDEEILAPCYDEYQIRIALTKALAAVGAPIDSLLFSQYDSTLRFVLRRLKLILDGRGFRKVGHLTDFLARLARELLLSHERRLKLESLATTRRRPFERTATREIRIVHPALAPPLFV